MTHIHPRDDFGYRFHHRPPNALAKKRLVLTIWLNVFMMIGEIVGGIWTGSLALLSDAGHMLSHVFALVISYVAIQLAAREHTPEKPFGYYRAEPIAALINGITILLIVVVIAFEAIKKLVSPQPAHDLQLWEVSSGMYAMTCHVLVADMLLSEAEVVKDAVNKVASEEFKIGHTNLQFERSSRAQPPAED